MQDDFMFDRIERRKQQNGFRELRLGGGIDFCSNDYLGMVRDKLLPHHPETDAFGSTGSRLLSGNTLQVMHLEKRIADFHESPAALLFNSGYDANLGFFSSVPQRGHTVFYDYLCHASIRDGLRLGLARTVSFKHNDLNDLEKKLAAVGTPSFVVTESVFSMDGDIAPLPELVSVCEKFGAALVVDEAHAIGLFGPQGRGLVQEYGLQERCFARIHTFGKALGCHGAAISGSKLLGEYLVNFCRPFIYTTALPPASVSTIGNAYALLPTLDDRREVLRELARIFQEGSAGYPVLPGTSAIQSVIISGNDAVKKVALICQDGGFDVRPILYPTVPAGSERLRIVLHAFNTVEEIIALKELLKRASSES